MEAAKILMEVSESNKLMGEVINKPKKQKAKEPTKLIFDTVQMKGAIESALTKYDSLESFFVQNRMKEICNLLIEEVKEDLMPTLAEDVIKQDAIREINNSV
eukprot:CAMPEP_0206197778 /NCGR_PEP_ID=MMETSP0166-20121206/9251_1 /ASSEMBLY_ACC=CAM_ASM_000260 /TAXON_ID=95228 /ORGANISM="Vannella robusta, Strain DIVA3 518/3/11/1/6" /LENGTH=101 /DNA_ID=CAMNT_0053615519 /DNA_START=488 /DNA_END=789 /DNA_ORIENTATION=+